MVGQLYAVELQILESQLNKNSITGVLQNPYNYTVGSIMVRAEFYDKEDGHLVGLRDFYEVSKDVLKPNEKSSFKIFEHAGETQEFPKTDFVVKAEGEDYTGMRTISAEEQIKQIEDLGNALKNLPDEVVINVIEYPNGTKQIVNKTVIYKNDSDDTP
jgi:glycosylphosphatidylinositol transamidase (GPIT) subunit GPI8